MVTAKNSDLAQELGIDFTTCSCTYCELYSSRIQDYEVKRWLTISPPPHMLGQRLDKDILKWMDILKPLKDIARDFVLVCELSEQLRLHFHIIYDRKDKVKEYKYVNGWKISSMVRVYGGLPKDGIHYLFKEVSETETYLNDKAKAKVIYTRDDFMEMFRKVKPLKRCVKWTDE